MRLRMTRMIMVSVARTRLLAFILLPFALFASSCSETWTIQTPELGMSRQQIEQKFKGLEKTELAWSFPSHEWGREGKWEVKFDETGLAKEATWYYREDTKGMVHASYIHVLLRTMKDMGNGSNEQPTFDTYQVWKKKEARYVLNLSNDSTKLYFQKLRQANVMAAN